MGRGRFRVRGLRDGAVYCIERLFYLPALVASGHKKIKLCNFENSAIAAVCQRHRGKS